MSRHQFMGKYGGVNAVLCNTFFGIAFAIAFAILYFLFLQRAVMFSVWAATDINSSVNKLHLQARADKLIETSSNSAKTE